MNQLYQQLNRSQPSPAFQENEQLNQIKGWIEQIKNMKNPEQGFQMLAQQNPQVQQIMNLINSMGTSPQQAFMQLAKMRGVNPEQIISMLK